jgi:UDPglucose 6-dehydrogenase
VRVTVAGLSHLGGVTAAGLASRGHRVVAYDPDLDRVRRLAQDGPGAAEPGLAALVAECVAGAKLAFCATPAEAASGAEVLWVAADTPLDEDERPLLAAVRGLFEELAGRLAPGARVVIASQVPVGFTRALARAGAPRGLRFACIPENLRLGAALEGFLRPERAIVGLARDEERATFEPLLGPLGWPIEWMSLESAELAKQARNAFLAASAAFANELARLCDGTGADAREVERALRADRRIGAYAYLSPGAPFSGGTLARDLRFLSELALRQSAATPLLEAVQASNAAHLDWLLERVRSRLPDESPVVALLGLAYKPAGGALQRSFALELGRRLRDDGVALRAHDPSLAGGERPAPQGLSACATAREALLGADVAVVATHWAEYLSLDAAAFLGAMRRPCVVDPGGWLAEALQGDARIAYLAPGRGEPSAQPAPRERDLAR